MDNWSVQRVSGGCISRIQPLIDPSSKLLLTCSGNTVRIFSTATGERIGSLIGHTQNITSLISDHSNTTQVLTASLDGTIRVWSLLDCTALKVYKAEAPIMHMSSSIGEKNILYLVIEHNNVNSDEKDKGRRWRLIEFIVKGSNGRRGKTLVKGGGETCRGLVSRCIRNPGNYNSSLCYNYSYDVNDLCCHVYRRGFVCSND